jgi:hemerythrin
VENFFQWRQDWHLGIKEIDAQHRLLVEGINKLASLYMKAVGISRDKSVLRAKLVGQLNLLHSDLEQHFHDEEKLMLASGYPRYRSHAHAHVMFLAEFKNYCHRITTRDEELDMKTLYSLKTWIITHIIDDREFASHFHTIQAADRTDRQAGRGD